MVLKVCLRGENGCDDDEVYKEVKRGCLNCDIKDE